MGDASLRKWVPLLTFLVALTLSALLSPWWNPWEYSLSALGSSSNGLAGAIFDGGVALTGVELTHVNVSHYQELVGLIAILALLVGAINIDFGIYHFIIATLLFLLMYLYVAMHGATATALALGSVSLWVSHWLWGLPPGIAVPELSAILITFYYLLKD